MADQRLRRKNRLSGSNQFKEHFQKARLYKTSALYCFLRPNPEQQECRLGLSVSRKITGAVGRNRIKRRLREIFRIHRPEWESNNLYFDLVVRPLMKSVDSDYQALEEQLLDAVEKFLKK